MRETTSQIVQKGFDKAVNKTADMFMQKKTNSSCKMLLCMEQQCIVQKFRKSESTKSEEQTKKLIDRHKSENAILVEEATLQKKHCGRLQEKLNTVTNKMESMESDHVKNVQTMRAANVMLHVKLRQEESKYRAMKTTMNDINNQLLNIQNERLALVNVCDSLEKRLTAQQTLASQLQQNTNCTLLSSAVLRGNRIQASKSQKEFLRDRKKRESKFEDTILLEKQKFHQRLVESKHGFEEKLSVEIKKQSDMIEKYENKWTQKMSRSRKLSKIPTYS